jgi:hypothetical protein
MRRSSEIRTLSAKLTSNNPVSGQSNDPVSVKYDSQLYHSAQGLRKMNQMQSFKAKFEHDTKANWMDGIAFCSTVITWISSLLSIFYISSSATTTVGVGIMSLLGVVLIFTGVAMFKLLCETNDSSISAMVAQRWNPTSYVAIVMIVTFGVSVSALLICVSAVQNSVDNGKFQVLKSVFMPLSIFLCLMILFVPLPVVKMPYQLKMIPLAEADYSEKGLYSYIKESSGNNDEDIETAAGGCCEKLLNHFGYEKKKNTNNVAAKESTDETTSPITANGAVNRSGLIQDQLAISTDANATANSENTEAGGAQMKSTGEAEKGIVTTVEDDVEDDWDERAYRLRFFGASPEMLCASHYFFIGVGYIIGLASEIVDIALYCDSNNAVTIITFIYMIWAFINAVLFICPFGCFNKHASYAFEVSFLLAHFTSMIMFLVNDEGLIEIDLYK